MQSKQNIIFLSLVIIILFLGNVFFGFNYFTLRREFQSAQSRLESQRVNRQVLDFFNFFIETVLKSKQEVNFETRLRLENAVRDIGDQEILAQWQNFTAAPSELDAQDRLIGLLQVLLKKIKVQ